MSTPTDSERLRQLLLGESAKTLEQAENYFNDPQKRAQDIANVLPSANLQAEGRHGAAFNESLRAPVNSAIRSAIKEDAQEFADNLYPAILPAIRRAINETMRQFIERIDTLMAQKYSAQSLKWRFEAIRTGVPFSEIILRKTLVYRIEQVLLIHNESGLLMQHVSLPEIEPPDSDAVSGMLWAIESFVRDSFTGDEKEGLNRVTMGDHIVYLVHGPKATLASVVRGVAPDDYFDRLRETLEQIHALHGDKIANFSGDKTTFDPVKRSLTERLESSFQNQRSNRSGDKSRVPGWLKWLGFASALAIVGLLAFSILTQIEKRKIKQLVTQLDAEPGIEVYDVDHEGTSWTIKGIRDPLATSPKTLLQTNNIDPDTVYFQLTPVLSLETNLLIRRARNLLAIPENIGIDLHANTLQLAGNATPVDYLRLTKQQSSSPFALAGITLDPSGLRVSAEGMRHYLQRVNALPTGISVALDSKDDQRLIFSGSASGEEKQRLLNTLAPFLSGLDVDTSGISSADMQQLQQLSTFLEKLSIPFSQGTSLGAGGSLALSQATSTLSHLHLLASQLGMPLQVHVIGETDSLGSNERNAVLRNARANAIIQHLSTKGIPASMLIPSTSPRYINPKPARQVRFETEIGQ
ncbi:MAG: hypothetical protein ACWA5X_10740 [bacterium]